MALTDLYYDCSKDLQDYLKLSDEQIASADKQRCISLCSILSLESQLLENKILNCENEPLDKNTNRRKENVRNYNKLLESLKL